MPPRHRRPLLLLVLILLPGIQGCGLGGLLYGDVERRVPQPFLVQDEPGRPNMARRIGQTSRAEPMTAEHLRREWGEPDARTRPDGSGTAEHWTYRRARLRWHGPLLILVAVPLPLLVPYGHESVTFTVEEGRVVEAIELRSRPTYGGFCGIPLLQAPLFGQWLVCKAGPVRLTEP